MLYFPFESNMDWDRVKHRERAPSAQFLLRATLPNHRLAFTRQSELQQTGTVDVVVCSARIVREVVFDIDPTDEPKLNTAEGVNSGACGREAVNAFAENNPTRPLFALTYVVSEKAAGHQASASWHLDHIVRGATRWGLPAEYRAEIQYTESL